jgi:drug/metabolite transporter (DMT)-like permease
LRICSCAAQADALKRPDASVLLVFLLVTLIGGTNFVAVRFSNRELAPFWGAGLRFAIAGALLVGFARLRDIPFPTRAALPGVLVFGTLNFGVTYALAYWGLLQAPAALGATLVALVPLVTFFMTTALRMERFRWAGLAGGALSLAGVGVVFADQVQFNVPLGALAALALQPVLIAAGTVLLKRIPQTHPIGTNAIAMLPGATLLLVLALLAGERLALPTRPDVVPAFLYLVTLGGIGLFTGIVYVVQRWTASASSYITVLFPVVTVAVGSAIAGEGVTPLFAVGALLVIAGTYVGAIAGR